MIELFPIRILNDRLERLIRWQNCKIDYVYKTKECIPLHHENRPERPLAVKCMQRYFLAYFFSSPQIVKTIEFIGLTVCITI